jgi:hypothetical protein
MIVISVSFSLIITVFGLGHALAKITIVGFGEFCHVYLLHCTFDMYILFVLPCVPCFMCFCCIYCLLYVYCALCGSSSCEFIDFPLVLHKHFDEPTVST